MAHIEQPDVIDLISINREKTEVHLGIVQQNAWDARTMELLRRKVRTYTAFIESGTMHRKMPETRDKLVVIEIGYFVEPNMSASQELDRIEAFLNAKRMKLAFRRLPNGTK